MTKRKSKRLLSLLLSLAMVFTLTATPVLAADTDVSGEVMTESTTEESTDSGVTAGEEADAVKSESEEADETESEDVADETELTEAVTEESGDSTSTEDTEASETEDASGEETTESTAEETTDTDAAVEEETDETESEEAEESDETEELTEAAADESGGTLTISSTSVTAASATAVSEEADVSGSGDDTTYSGETVDDTLETVEATDEAEKETEDTAVVAKINNTRYGTLAAAFAAATSGATITLTGDLTVTDGEYSANGLYQVSTNVTLDLNNSTLTVNTTRVFGILDGGSLTIKNGTVKIADDATSTGNQFNILRGTCSFTAENVTFDSNSIAANFLHVAADGTATISLTNCNITNQSGGVVVYDNDGNSTVTLTGCNYATNPNGGALKNIANFKIVFNSNNQITSESTNWEVSNSLRYTYVVADGGSVAADLTLTTTKGAASLTVEGGSVTGSVTVASGTSMTVSGGTVTGAITTSGTFTMTGGTVTASSSASQAVLVKGGTVNISGGTISASSSRALVFDTDVTVSGSISGGTFTGYDIALLARSSENNTVSVTGGTYTATKGIDLVASILADGYGVFDTKGDAATVSGNYYISSLDDKTVWVGAGVAKVGDTLYSTLQSAINAATSGDTVTLLTNVEEDVVVESGKTIILNLAGYSITADNSHAIANYGTLTIEDSSATTATEESEAVAGTGKVIATVGSTAALYNQGEVILNGGTFSRGSGTWYTIVNEGSNSKMIFNTGVTVETSPEVDNNSSMIRNYGGTMTVNGGTFISDCLSCIKNEPDSILTINGGIIKNLAEGASSKQGAIINAGTVTVNGGTIYSYSSAIFGTSSSYPGIVSINGGTFYNLRTAVASSLIGSYQYNANTNTQNCYITGGTFTGYSVYPKYLASTEYSLLFDGDYNGELSNRIFTVAEDVSGWSYEAMRETTYGTVYFTDADNAFNTTYFSGYSGTIYLYAALDEVTDVKVNTTGYTLVLMENELSTEAQSYTSHFACYGSTGYELLSTTDTVTYDEKEYNTVTVYQGVTKESANASITIGENTTYYATLSAAVTAANSMDLDGSETITVKALNDHTYSTAMIPTVSMTIDLNGCTYTSTSSTGTIKVATSGITVTVVDSSESKAGALYRQTSTVKLCTVSAGTLELTSGTYTGTFAGVTTGTLEISGGTYTSDPTSYLAGGCYVVTNDNSTYTVEQLVLGASGDNGETTTSVSVNATSIANYGTGSIYVGVSSSDISKYGTTNYPTTDLTYTPTEGSSDSGSYIFAGWFTLDEDGGYTACSNKMWSRSDTDTTYYAMFVDANTLSVSCFFTPYDEKNALRFFTSQAFVYADAGFNLYINGTLVENAITSVTYHTSSYKVCGTSSSPVATFMPSTFSSSATAVVTGRYYDTSKATSFSVVPYWTTQDGTTIYGTETAFSCSDGTTQTVLTSTTDED
ncbi:MAG: hypothetical protein LUF35_11080 [Lachnospiraceae bacterium]|nr:hypothetical protein [Lachnospiraceae bacterium]